MHSAFFETDRRNEHSADYPLGNVHSTDMKFELPMHRSAHARLPSRLERRKVDRKLAWTRLAESFSS
jgi:hypothetical protein